MHISDPLFKEAKKAAKIPNRSIEQQIEYWATVWRCVEENPDLPLPLIQDILGGLDEMKAGKCTEYQFS